MDPIPFRALVAVAVLVSVLMTADFTALVEANMNLCATKSLFQYASYLVSRSNSHDKPQACKV